MRLIIIFFFTWILTLQSFAYDNLHYEKQLEQDLKQIQNANKALNQNDIAKTVQIALNAINDSKVSNIKIKEYKKIINDFPLLAQHLRNKRDNESDKPDYINLKLTINELNQKILYINNQLLDLSNKLKKEQNQSRIISNLIIKLPQQQIEARRNLNNVEQKLKLLPTPKSTLEKLKFITLQAEKNAYRLKIEELNLAKLSANNRQELSNLRIELLKKRYDSIYITLQVLRNQMNRMCQQKIKQVTNHTTTALIDQTSKLPKSIKNLIHINHELSIILNQYSKHINFITFKQHQIDSQILQVRKALVNLKEQSQWLDESPALGEILRAQISKLPEIPKHHQLDVDMSKLRVQRLYFEDLVNKIPQLLQSRQDNGSLLTTTQYNILNKQLFIQKNLLNNLITSCDNQILELTKLKVANSQLEEVTKEIQEATHRYLFWVADVSPINLSYFIKVGQDLRKIITIDTLNQLTNAFSIMLTSQGTFIPLFGVLLLFILSFGYRKHYNDFLERSSNCVGKVNQDHFYLTLYNVFWSILVALPLPTLWATLGYGLRHTWQYPIAVTIGDGVIATVPILCIFMICAKFARPKGLFIVHFGWPNQQVKRALRYYTLSIGMIVPLITVLISLDNYSEREYIGTIGRLCFILLCICSALVTNSFKRAGLLLYLNKHGNSNNIINSSLWNIIICAPITAAIASSLGYLSTAQVLLIRLETSVAIWFLLLIIYYIIRRWMFIQRRRIAFDRAKQRRAEMLAQRARSNEEDLSQFQLNDVAAEIDEKVLDLDTISAQSLQLVRSILTLIALLSVIILWSELHSAFGFLENIVLWKISSNIKEVNILQSITLGTVLIATLIFIITTKLVRNLPALLELAILQHLDLAPGTGYAITTLTKYSLMLIGFIISFSIIGIDWSKLQWLVAALGVGLGFGLQEIFANFVSGLIILFEKPIRIGDTVTIRNLTGNITRINTRATTITDWDRKEIIVPNKAFITEQFVNWSLSDTVTRVVLNVPAPIGVNIEEITHILMQAAYRCPLVLKLPTPEAFLVDLQQGLPIFELRMYAAEMGHRMPLRHQVHKLIIESYKEHKMDLPFPTFQIYRDQIKVNDSMCNYINSKNKFL